MYFPVGWPKQLRVSQDVPLVHLCTSQNRMFFAILKENAISIWYCKPSVEIVCFRRSDNSVCEFGANVCAKWKPDNSMIAVATSKGYILFYNVEIDTGRKNSVLYVLREERWTGNKQEQFEEYAGEHIPALKLTQAAYIQVPGGVTSMVCLRDELMVATGHGCLQRIRWDGLVNGEMTIELHTIPFAVDLQYSRASQITDMEVYVEKVQYSQFIGGFAIVLSNGRAAFITASSLKFEPSQVVGVWAQEVTAATAIAVNHKYTLMAFGTQSGEGLVYNLEDTTGALSISHKLVVSSKDFPDACNVCGAVNQMKWTPDGCALALTWQKGGFSLWSVFGALLVHSMGSDLGGSLSDDAFPHHSFTQIIAMEWASEGYNLWMISVANPKESTELAKSDAGEETENHNLVYVPALPRLMQLQFVKSVLTVNPCTTNHQYLFLQGEDKLYLNPEESFPQLTDPALQNEASLSPISFIGNKQWQIVPIPHSYLSMNWPIRFAAVSAEGNCVAVAGRTGFAHYALFSRKWKLFGNETQERDMVVTGGLLWWDEFVCVACYNMLDQRDEIRFYPRDSKLDNTFSKTVKVPSEVMLLNTFRDVLIVLCADCHIMIFKMESVSPNGNTIEVEKLQEVAIGNFIPHPAMVVAITLTTIRTEIASMKMEPVPNEAESIILNVSGKLLMFQRDRSGPQVKSTDTKERPLPFCAPNIVASSVENMWFSPSSNGKKPHLTEALWLGCGASGVKVWLPLEHKEDKSKARSFMSRRIMLPFLVDIYPLALLFESGIILGATSESLSYQTSSVGDHGWPYLQLERTSQVYLHHVLRQLLRRNLGGHALEIARSCNDLPFFHHVLELLLHKVLEEEATSKEPIPDPLLPRVVAFVQEFPEYLQTVAHCARKSEVALWHYLFSTVGQPKDLFEECLVSDSLDTAASYLIILQNLEKPMVARQHATLLLDASLEQCNWNLARDLVRFLGAIDPAEAESPHPPSKARMSTSSIYPTTYPNPSISPAEKDPFGYPPTAVRGRSLTKDDPPGKASITSSKDTIKNKDKIKRSTSDPQNTGPGVKGRTASGSKEDSADQFFIDTILSRHARKLLCSYRVRDLACFAANLEDYQLVSWLKKERLRAARIEDFVICIKKVHGDFKWPLPVLTLTALQRISSASSLQSQASSFTNPLEVDVNGCYSDMLPTVTQTLSNTSLQHTNKPSKSAESSHSTAEILLKPQPSIENVSRTATEHSDSSSFVGDLESGDSSMWSETGCLSQLEQLSHELANKGSQQSESELRYLFQIMLEAGCLEWSLLIAVVLRDAMAVVRTINTASLTDTPLEIISRMREGMSFLELWANTECFGYKPFLQAIDKQTKLLQKIGECTPPTPRIKRLSSSSSESSPNPLDQCQLIDRDLPSPVQTVPEAANGESESPENNPQSKYECRIS